MPLPSQQSRETHGSRAHVFRRKARGPGPIAIAGVAGLCAIALLYVVVRPLVWGPSPARGEGPQDGPATGDQAAAQPSPTREGSPPQNARATPPAPIREPVAERPTPQGVGAESPAPIGAAPGSSPATLAVTPAPAAPAGPSESVSSALRSAETEARANRPVVAREILLRALGRDGLPEADARRLRDRIGELNQEILFSPRVYADDPLSGQYTVQSGDSLSRIASRQGLAVDWRAIQRVNAMTSDRIRLGQTLKVLRGPFHAVVDKSDFRLDLFAGPPDARDEWVFIRSFPVGLGAGDGTPVGDFIVKQSSRLVNPEWVNPQTGERFGADDPLNPIGERWVGIRGLGDSAVFEGFGIHGTIEPESIGQQKSMGCVRMLSPDVEVVYELLMDEISRVSIVP